VIDSILMRIVMPHPAFEMANMLHAFG